jgi:hypothetical protein
METEARSDTLSCSGMKTFIGLLIILVPGCHQKKLPMMSDAEILHRNQDQLTQVIIYDVFTPPVASRIYVYSSLASYEAIRFSKEGAPSVAEKLKDFGQMPKPEINKEYNYTLAASKAFFNVAHNVKVFSVDSLKDYEEALFYSFSEELDDSVYQRSIAFGDTIASVILARARNDGYLQSRGKAKYLGSNDPGKWKPTPPDYLDGVEWCWNTMKPMIMDSASQFMPDRPPLFSTDSNSVFFKSVREVYEINKNLTEEQMDIARYWDDNPLVIMHSGHMMFGNKKITPGGHWMGICAIASKQSGADAVKTARAYALTALALYESFLSCWDEKYTSGHSTITACAATVLTDLFGDNFAFQDTSDLRYIGMQRHFNSFHEAAAEVSISRVYGGIHYRFSVDIGAEKGNALGVFINEKLSH